MVRINAIFEEQRQLCQSGGNMLSAFEVPGNQHLPEIFVDRKRLPIQT